MQSLCNHNILARCTLRRVHAKLKFETNKQKRFLSEIAVFIQIKVAFELSFRFFLTLIFGLFCLLESGITFTLHYYTSNMIKISHTRP